MTSGFDHPSTAKDGSMSRAEISAKLDITDPFLMIDSFRMGDDGATAFATKDLQSEDWFFDCHLPGEQVMPATLQIEGMLQTLVLLIYAAKDHGAKRSFVTDINAKLLSAATPGLSITYEASLKSFRRGIAKGEVIGTSEGKVLCRGEFGYASPHLMAVPTQ